MLSCRIWNKWVLDKVPFFVKLNARPEEFTRTLSHANKMFCRTYFILEERWTCQVCYDGVITKKVLADSLNRSSKAFKNVFKHPERFGLLPISGKPSKLSKQHCRGPLRVGKRQVCSARQTNSELNLPIFLPWNSLKISRDPDLQLVRIKRAPILPQTDKNRLVQWAWQHSWFNNGTCA